MVNNLNERWLIDQLRKEASDFKSCFTNFSFQALAFSAAALGIILGFMGEGKNQIIVFAVIPVILLLMIICRIGLFKYTSAHRHNGYELHLARLNFLMKTTSSEMQKQLITELKEIRWEEAVKAWRVVQTKIFKTIYKTPDATEINDIPVLKWWNKIRTGLYRWNSVAKELIDDFKECKENNPNRITGKYENGEYPWFMPKLLTATKNGENEQETYHSGMYLENMMSILLLMQYLLLSPIGILIYWKFSKSDISLTFWLLLGLFVLLSAVIFLRQIRIHRRRDILENELLSIHSCGIMWHAVVLAHHLAFNETNGLEHYTERLIKIAKEMSLNIGKIHQWISDNMKQHDDQNYYVAKKTYTESPKWN